MGSKELRELLQHYYRRTIIRFCIEPRTFQEIVDHLAERAGIEHGLAHVLAAEHLAILEEKKAVKPTDGRWAATEEAIQALKK
ncbi:MAG: hypothetical protein QW638_08380 [Candidatus Bathyarchaeia archaeon]|nr:hypothetical protein [Candidatus Bathyarchaeota archaeon]